MRLEGRVALIVGGGQTPGDTIGNGRATALRFAQEGACVVVADRDLARAEATVEAISEAGGEAVAITLDVTRDADCAAGVAACAERFGGLDIVVHNAGIGTGDTSASRVTDETWDRIFDVNLKGVLHTSRYAVPALRARGGGAFVLVSSIAAVCAAPMVAYKTSKAALNALAHNLAMGNAKHGVRVNVIMPGLINTPMAIEGISGATGVPRETLVAQRDALVPLRGGMGSAWDVANATLFLASDEARFITGVVLPVDGGQSARIG